MDNVAFITEVLNGGMNLVLAVAVYSLWKKLNDKEDDCAKERKQMLVDHRSEIDKLHKEHREDLRRLGDKLDNLNERAWTIASAWDSVTTDDGS